MTHKTRIMSRNCEENQLLFHNSISVVLSEFPNETHNKHWFKRLITKEPCLKHFSKKHSTGTQMEMDSLFFLKISLCISAPLRGGEGEVEEAALLKSPC